MKKSLTLWPIGNCQVSALVDEAAGMVWACQPQVDGDPLFCSLLDPKRDQQPDLPAGEWRVTLKDQVSAKAGYLPNTAILSTILTDKRGASAEVIDFCPRFERRGRMYRPVSFIRLLRPVHGAPQVGLPSIPPPVGAPPMPSAPAHQSYRFCPIPSPFA